MSGSRHTDYRKENIRLISLSHRVAAKKEIFQMAVPLGRGGKGPAIRGIFFLT